MPAKTPKSKAIATATTILLAWTLTACATADPAGEGSPAPEPDVETTAEPVAETESADEAAVDEPQAHDGDGIGDIPLPEGHMVVDSQGDEATGENTMLVHVPGDYEDHADFYREELPKAGWEIVSEEPSEGGFGTLFEVTSDTTRAWIQCETFDGGTAIFISAYPLDADVTGPGQAPGGSDTNGVMVDLPADFPISIALPLFAPSELVTGVPHGDDMWVLEYVATTDMATVGAGIEEDIAFKDWTIIDRAPDGPGTKYELEKPGYELTLVILPERSNEADTSLHYTLRMP